MDETTQGLKQDIEDTRSAMGDTLEAIGDRVSPGRILERRRNRMVGWARDTKDKVMGTADDLKTHVGDGVHHVGNAPSSTVDTLTSRTQGTPLVAGGIAFGVGVLLGSILPPSRTEQRLAEQARTATEPLKAELQDAGREMVDHLKEPVHEAVETVKATAQDSAQHLRDTTHDGVDQVQQHASN
jgi:gas vesicle protein